jgi:enterochelin esterase-like enzyme
MDAAAASTLQVRRFVRFWENQQLSRARRVHIAASRFERRCNSTAAAQRPPSMPLPPPASDKARYSQKCAEASRLSGVPVGSFHEHKAWGGSVVYPGTLRDFDVWLPDADSASNEDTDNLGVIVVADGKAAWRFATSIDVVLSNLIHQKKIPLVALVLCGVGYEPNTGAETMPPKALFPQSMAGMVQRMRELDVVSEEFGEHIDGELLPFIARHHGVTFSSDPAKRVMCGQSSGGIAALSAAWHRPDRFGKVICISTSFCNSLPGYMLPQEVRLTSPKKPLRIYLSVGEHDVVTEHGDWCEHTLLMGKALAFKGYDYRCEVAEGGGHTLRYTGTKLGNILTWVFGASSGSSEECGAGAKSRL